MSAIQKLKTLLTVFLSLVLGLVVFTSPIAFAFSRPVYIFYGATNSSGSAAGWWYSSDGDGRVTYPSGSNIAVSFYIRDNTSSSYVFNLSYHDISNATVYVYSNGSLISSSVNPGSITLNTTSGSNSDYFRIVCDSTISSSYINISSDFFISSQDISDSYNNGYSDGYDVGYSSGVRSVDPQSIYTSGYNDGYSIGYSDGLLRGSGDSPLSSINRFYVPIDNYSVNATGNNSIFLNTDSFNNVWSAQEYYDLTGQTQFINTWLINTVTSSALRVTDGTFLVRAGSPFRISNIQIPKGAYPVITFHGVFVAGVGIGSNGSFPVTAPGVSGGVVYMPYSSFKLELTRSTGISVSSLRAWFGDSNNQQFQSSSNVSSANASASYIFNPLDLDCFRADFEVSVTGPDYYFVSIGYYYDDPNSNLLAEILDRLDNGNSSTSSVVDKINGAIQSFDSSVSTINDFEDSMLGSFNNSSGTVNSTVSNFSFGRQFLNAANWLSGSMQSIYSSSSHFQMFWVFPIILAVALVFIGGGIGSKHD